MRNLRHRLAHTSLFRRRQTTTPNGQGFTIVELLVVIVVIGVLAAITVVAYNGVQVRAIDAQKATILTTVQKAIENYYTVNGRYPASDEMASEADLQQFGLRQKDVVPSGGVLGWGVRLGWSSSGSVNLNYIAHPNPNGSGFQCNKPTICRHYTLSYWSYVNNQAVTVRNGQ